MNPRIDVLIIKDIVMMPEELASFDLGKDQSQAAVKQALLNNRRVILVCQKDPDVKEPDMEQIYRVGTLSKVVQMPSDKEGIMRIRLMGEEIVQVREYEMAEDGLHFVAEIEPVVLTNFLSEPEEKAYRQELLDKVEPFFSEKNEVEQKRFAYLSGISSLHKLILEILHFLNFEYQDKQKVIEEFDLAKRAELLGVMISNALEYARIRMNISDKIRTNIEERQKQNLYREQIQVLKKELGEEDTQEDDEVEEYQKRLEELAASDEVKKKISSSIKRFSKLSSRNSEAAVLQEYIETMLDVPWQMTLPENRDIAKAEAVLERDHYGLEKIKERIVEFLAVHIHTGSQKAPILCLVGPPGTGKTSIAKSIARALNRNYERICLGGVHDEAEIRGHRKTYVGAMPGRIVTAMRHAKSSNPLLLLDEIDKMGTDHRGDISSAMLEVLDPAQNNKFRDHYLEMPLDLSNVLFVATANKMDGIPKPLLDRMEVITVNSYLEQEKYEIARRYLVKKQMVEHGLTTKELSISKSAIYAMIREYTREAGVRNLERNIGTLCRKVVKQQLEQGEAHKISITAKNLKEYLGSAKYHNKELSKRSRVGLVHGLAWTSVGGDTLDIEVLMLPGEGKITFTGNMGDVMKESAQLAALCARDLAIKDGKEASYFKEHDIHLHIPEGAVPKDGPSAGITMATAIYSAVMEKKVDYGIAMTGELSLLGNVLPIGGLREKVVAAKARQIKRILVPEENRRDIEELPDEVKEGMTFLFVTTLKQVIAEVVME